MSTKFQKSDGRVTIRRMEMKLESFRQVMATLSGETRPPAKPTGPVFADKDGNVIVQVLAKPGAKSNGVTGVEKEGVGIQINARPVDGEANAELVKYVMAILGLKRNEISLDKGMKSRQKVLLISKKDFTPDKIMEKLKQEMNE